MTLRELINSVDSDQYSDSSLYQKLRETKPEYGSNRRIQVKLVNSEVVITNVHVGSLGDIITYPIDVDPDLNISKVQLLDAIFRLSRKNGCRPINEKRNHLFTKRLRFYVAEREVSLAEGEAPYIIPSNTLRTSTVSICPYVVRFLICN